MQSKLIIKAVGDIASGDCTIDGLGVCSISKKYGCDYAFEKLNGLLGNADLQLGNLEGPLSGKSKTHDLRLCGLPDMAKSLKKAGFDVLSLANNHAFDHGKEIFQETVKHCEEAGIELCGLRGGLEYYSQPVIINRKDVSIGILAYNWIGLENAESEISNYIATVKDGVVNYTWNRDKENDIESRRMVLEKNKDVFNDIRKLRDKVDILILMPHWGYEWVNHPPYGVITEAHSFIDAGVDFIFGSHPHVIQGFEKYSNGFIAYSLGNFLFDFSTERNVSGMCLENEIVGGRLKEYKSRFITWNKDYQPEEALGRQRERCEAIIERSNKAIVSDDAEQELDDNLVYNDFEKKYNGLKLQKVMYLFKSLPGNPSLIKPIIRKFYTLIELIMLRISGKRVRW